MREVFTLLNRLAPTEITITLIGETGTGKDVLARAIHNASMRAAAPFAVFDCGAVAPNLVESELFGHERGSFTGALANYAGAFERANGGTIFLDEIGELPLDLQPKLLRVLETGRLRRVGGAGEVGVRVRVVAMTLRDLQGDVSRRSFRGDLYYRLAGFCVRLPPLRERRGDIPLLAAHFLREISGEVGDRQLEAAAVAAAYRFAEDEDEPAPASTPPPAPAPVALPDDAIRIAGRSFDEIEREIFGWALRQNGGSRRRAARALRIARSTFCDKVKRYGL